MDPYTSPKSNISSQAEKVSNWLTKIISTVYVLYCWSLIAEAIQTYQSHQLYGKTGDSLELYATVTPFFLVLIALLFLLTYFWQKKIGLLLLISILLWITFLIKYYFNGSWKPILVDTIQVFVLALWITINGYFGFFQEFMRAMKSKNSFIARQLNIFKKTTVIASEARQSPKDM